MEDSGNIVSSRGRGSRRAALIVAALALAGLAALAPGWLAGAGAQSLPEFSVRVSGSKSSPERMKSIPITRGALDAKRSVLSLDPADVGALRSGDRIEASAELEVSVTCLEPMSKCVGSIYRYTPTISSRLVIARERGSTGGGSVTPISSWKEARCSQEQPNRNHHCVVVIPAASRVIDNVDKLPCDPRDCHVNLVVSAWHKHARSGNKLVIGADDEGGVISQDKSVINASVYHPEKPVVSPTGVNRPLRYGVPIGTANGHKRVVYSARLPELRAGEQLVVDAKLKGRISHLSYNVLVQSQLVLSEKPGSTRRNGVPAKIADRGARFNPLNGFNCTQGPSGHPDPCMVRKVGVLRIIRDARTKPERNMGSRVPLYLNLVVASRAVYGSGYRSGDKIKIAPRGGYLHVYRYDSSMRG